MPSWQICTGGDRVHRLTCTHGVQILMGDHWYTCMDTLATQIIFRVNPVSPAMDALRRVLPIAKHLAWFRVKRVLAPGGNVMSVPASKPGVAKFCVWLFGDLRCGPSCY